MEGAAGREYNFGQNPILYVKQISAIPTCDYLWYLVKPFYIPNVEI